MFMNGGILKIYISKLMVKIDVNVLIDTHTHIHIKYFCMNFCTDANIKTTIIMLNRFIRGIYPGTQEA